MDKYHLTRQVILDLLEELTTRDGFANAEIAKLHIDAATDRIQAIWQ